MSTAENYLRDVIALLVERGRDAKKERITAEQAGAQEQAAFERGRALGYYEVVSMVLGQLTVHGLSPGDLGVPRDFVPEKELL